MLIDMPTAFDTVDLAFMFHWLKTHLGITGNVLSWFHSYLQHCKQSVTVLDASFLKDLKYGVPRTQSLTPISSPFMHYLYIISSASSIQIPSSCFICWWPILYMIFDPVILYMLSHLLNHLLLRSELGSSRLFSLLIIPKQIH